MSNPTFPENLLKIGFTKKHPNIRAINLQTSGIPTPFKVEYVIITPDGFKLEKQIHNHLKKYRENENREFFKISKYELAEILKNELLLELTSIDEITTLITTTPSYGKKVNEIKTIYEDLKKDADTFFIKFKKDNSKLVVKKIKSTSVKKHVFLIESEGCTPLTEYFYDDEELAIIRIYRKIMEAITNYEECLYNLITNYKEIKNTIGVELLRNDNKYFKERILDTQKDLCNLKDEYIWEL